MLLKANTDLQGVRVLDLSSSLGLLVLGTYRVWEQVDRVEPKQGDLTRYILLYNGGCLLLCCWCRKKIHGL